MIPSNGLQEYIEERKIDKLEEAAKRKRTVAALKNKTNKLM